jgi:sec-independent protein translocase protein TatA
MNDVEKPADPTAAPAQPVQPAQPVHPQATQPVNAPHTIDVQAQKVEEPVRKDS